MLKKIKLVTLKTLKQAGLFTFFKNGDWRRQRLLILAYHGISIDDEHLWNPALYMSPDDFRARMQLIKDFHANVLPLGQALDRLYANALPSRSVVLTFDDGTHDFYRKAYPIIKQFEFPVTVYLTTFYSHYNRPVFNGMCSYLIWKGRRRTLALEKLTGENASLDLSTAPARAVAVGIMHAYAQARRLSAEEKDSLCLELARQLDVDYDALLSKRILHIMTPAEAKELAADGADVQLHTHRHRTPLDRLAFRREIMDNQSDIQGMTGSLATHFCYPSGVYDDALFPWLEEMGVRSATTCTPALATRDSDRLLLPRLVDSPNVSPVEFEGWLAGLSTLLPQRHQPKRVARRVASL